MLPHKQPLAVGDIASISGIVSVHAGVVVERSHSYNNSAREAWHQRCQSRASAVIRSHPQSTCMRDFAAKWRDWALVETKALGTNQSVE
jgi:hypothetical protein